VANVIYNRQCRMHRQSKIYIYNNLLAAFSLRGEYKKYDITKKEEYKVI